MINDNTIYCSLDYETRSKKSLEEYGAYEYAKDPSTKILCVAYQIGTRSQLLHQLKNKIPANVYSPFLKNTNFSDLYKAFMDEKIILVAHNAFFEQVITRFVFAPTMYSKPYLANIPHDRWICTAALAAALSLPRKLEKLGPALTLPVLKDMEGHKLMLKMSKPRKPTKDNKGVWHSKLSDLKRLIQYCQTDVYSETWAFLQLKPLIDIEREIWLLDQKINFRGFKVDRPLVEKILKDIDTLTTRLTNEFSDLTGLNSPGQNAKLLKYLRSLGADLPNMQAKTVSDTLLDSDSLSDKVVRILEIKQAMSKTSTAKYEALEFRSRSDSRVRDILMYHGAGTGRWSGRGSQIQNFPRSCPKNIEDVVKDIRESSLDDLELYYGNALDLFSNCLKGMIIPEDENHIFNCADYSAIEARVLFWMAKHSSGVKAYIDKRDLYREMATDIYNIDHIENVTDEQRQVAKRAILGCGYGMGHKKFKETCKIFGLEISEDLARKAVTMYRAKHKPIPIMWSNLEKAGIAATLNPGKKFMVNYTTWYVSSKYLFCRLPSGRELAYYGPEVHYDNTPWGDKRPVLYHFGNDSKTHQWVKSNTYGGRLTENVVSGTARDIMAAAMLRLDAAGYKINFTVHDEILAERVKNRGSLKEFLKLMTTLPDWAVGCPITAEGWEGRRYKKG